MAEEKRRRERERIQEINAKATQPPKEGNHGGGNNPKMRRGKQPREHATIEREPMEPTRRCRKTNTTFREQRFQHLWESEEQLHGRGV